MTEESIDGIKVNGRSYRKPTARTVVICFDGCDPRYISHGLSAGLLPNISKIMSEGFFAIADAAMPTFTNPNNMSIVTGAPPKVHGISGNYYLDKATGREVMITDASLVSSGTVLAALADAGVQRAERLGLRYLVTHPGASLDAGEEFGLAVHQLGRLDFERFRDLRMQLGCGAKLRCPGAPPRCDPRCVLYLTVDCRCTRLLAFAPHRWRAPRQFASPGGWRLSRSTGLARLCCVQLHPQPGGNLRPQHFRCA